MIREIITIIFFCCLIIDYSATAQCTERSLTLDEIREILFQHPCISSVQRQKRQQRKPSSEDHTENRINAIHGTINEHRSIINYLINNSVNTTFVQEAITSYYTSKMPNLSSWRDLSHILILTIFIGVSLYFLISRCTIEPIYRCLLCLSKRLVPHIQQKEEMINKYNNN
jgi:hypothetical protein